MAESLKEAACKDLDEAEINSTSRADLEKHEESSRQAVLDCKDLTEVEFAARWNGEFSEADNLLLEYGIKNVGAKAATDIRIQGKDLNSLQYQSGKTFIDLQKKKGNEFFELPNLNPGESVRVLAWSSGYFPSLTYADWDDFPIVTFAGSQVHTELMKDVPDGWCNIYDFFTNAPLIIVLAFVIFISISVCFALYLLIGFAMSLATGRSFKEVFSNGNGKEESTSRHDSAVAS